jgi:hypothetical protein
MHLFSMDVQKVRRVGGVPGLSAAELSGVFARSTPAAGTPVLLSGSMWPVEPLCSWFRELSLNRRSVKTMRAYAYTALMLLRFLHARGLDLASATEQDVLEFRRWRLDDADETVGEAAWDRDAAAIGSRRRRPDADGVGVGPGSVDGLGADDGAGSRLGGRVAAPVLGLPRSAAPS